MKSRTVWRRKPGSKTLVRCPLTCRSKSVDLASIGDRYKKGLRTPSVSKVVDLAKNISTSKLLQPLCVDNKNRVLAGMHRLMALRMLATPPDQRKKWIEEQLKSKKLRGVLTDDHVKLVARIHSGKPDEVQVQSFNFSSKRRKNRGVAEKIELDENEQRSDLSAEEIKGLVERLKEEGFTNTKGPRKDGVPSLNKKVAKLLGKSVSQAKRYINKTELSEKSSRAPCSDAVVRRCFRSMTKLVEDLMKVKGGKALSKIIDTELLPKFNKIFQDICGQASPKSVKSVTRARS